MGRKNFMPVPGKLQDQGCIKLLRRWFYVCPHGSGSPSGCNRITACEPVVVPAATLDRPTGYLLPTLRVGLASRKQWEDLTQTRADMR